VRGERQGRATFQVDVAEGRENVGKRLLRTAAKSGTIHYPKGGINNAGKKIPFALVWRTRTKEGKRGSGKKVPKKQYPLIKRLIHHVNKTVQKDDRFSRETRKSTTRLQKQFQNPKS